MQSPDIHSEVGSVEGEAVDEVQLADDNEQRERRATFTIELHWFGKSSDVHKLLEYLDRSVSLRFHDESLHFKAREDGKEVGEEAGKEVQFRGEKCRLCGTDNGSHHSFCRFGTDGTDSDG